MKAIFLTFFLFVLFVFQHPFEVFAGGSPHEIKVLVGDSPITNYQINQRINLHLMSSKDMVKALKASFKSKRTQERWRAYIQEKRPSSREEVSKLQQKFVKRLQRDVFNRFRPKLRKTALDELINERIMISVAKENNIIISDATIDQQILRIAQSNSKGVSPAKAKAAFYAHLRSRNVGQTTFREKLRANAAWQKVVRKKFGHEIRFGDRDVEEQLGLTDEEQKKVDQFNLQKIVINIRSQKDQAAVVKQYVEADKIRQRFNGCANMKSLIAPFKNAKVIALGQKSLDQIPSPTNMLLSDMKAGQMTPPQPSAEGIEMYAVCDRNRAMVNSKERKLALNKMRQKAFQMRAKRYLSDLRQDVHIEMRN